MKRVVSIITLVFFLLTTNGFAVNVNYCCGKIRSVTLTGTAGQKSCRQMKSMRNCCRQQHKYIKLKVHTLASASHAVPNNVSHLIAVFNYNFVLHRVVSSPVLVIRPFASPPGKPCSYLLNCSILVWFCSCIIGVRDFFSPSLAMQGNGKGVCTQH